jgi:hypothetical protein
MSAISHLTVEIANHNKVRCVNCLNAKPSKVKYVICWNSQIHRKVIYAKH